jgi:hypothetical protein
MKSLTLKIIIGSILATTLFGASLIRVQAAAFSCEYYGPPIAGLDDPNSSQAACQAIGGTPVSADSNPSTAINIALTKQSYFDAQANPAACSAFSVQVATFSSGDFRAEFFPAEKVTTERSATTTAPASCHIVQKGFKTGDSLFSRAEGAYYLETQLQTGTSGVTQNDYTTAAKKGTASLNNDVNPLITAIITVLNWIFKILTFVVFNLTALAGQILSWAISFGTIQNLPVAVHKGWVIVRDVFNMFFILVLIIMSLATILRREEYNYRKILLKLILIALVINFSEAICVAVIHFADSVALIFAKDAQINDYFATLTKILSPDAAQQHWYTAMANPSSDTVRAISGFILACVMMSAFLAMALLMVVRYVGLLFLVVLSPAAFALYIFPNTKKYFDTWREHFVKYVIWLPVSMFFLRLGHVFFSTGATDNVLNSSFTNPDLSLLIIAGFYWGAFYVTKSSGLYGAQAVASWGQSAASMAGKWAARGTFIRHAGNLMGGDTTLGKFTGGTYVKKFGTAVEKQTARIEGLPDTISAPLKRAEKAREKLVSTQSRMDQIKARLLPVDKDTASSLTFEELKLMNDKKLLDQKTIGTIYEHGGMSQRTSLLALLNAKEIKDQKAIDAIRDGEWDKIGAKGQALEEKFLVDRKEDGNLIDVQIRNPKETKLKDQKIKSVNTRFKKDKKKRNNNSDDEGGGGSGRYKQTPGFGGGAPVASINPSNRPPSPPAPTGRPTAPTPTSGGAGGSSVSRTVAATSTPPRQTVAIGGPGPVVGGTVSPVKLDVGNFKMDIQSVQNLARGTVDNPSGGNSAANTAPTGRGSGNTENRSVGFNQIPMPVTPAASTGQQSGPDAAGAIRKVIAEGVKEGVKGVEDKLNNTNAGLKDLDTTAKETSVREIQKTKDNADKVSESVNKLRQETESKAESQDLNEIANKLDELNRNAKKNNPGTIAPRTSPISEASGVNNFIKPKDSLDVK